LPPREKPAGPSPLTPTPLPQGGGEGFLFLPSPPGWGRGVGVRGEGPANGPSGSALLDQLQRRGGEVDAEAVAPDGNHPVLAQVHLRGEFVVLVPLVALELG